MPRKYETTFERFKTKYIINQKTGCWEWIAAKNKDGYGVFTVDGKYTRANRASYKMFKGDINGGLYVLHRCDNPKCVNPEHLFLGTAFDNMEDAQKKGRIPITKCPSISSYAIYGCRCDECKKIMLEFWRKHRNIKKTKRLALTASAE